MFVRAKTIKGIKYGYLVENSWHKGKVKQTVKKYLGKIVPLPELEAVEPILSDIDVQNSKQEELIKKVIEQDLITRGVTKKENHFFYENTVIDLDNKKIVCDDKPAVLMLNKRYVSADIFSDLINFLEPETEDDRPGQKLAKAFRNAGIAIAKEDFIVLYKRIY